MKYIVSFITNDSNFQELQSQCKKNGFTWITTNSETQLLSKVQEIQPDVVLVSIPLSKIFSNSIVEEIRLLSFKTRICALLQSYSVADRINQFKQGADDLLSLPYNPRECALRLTRLYALHRHFPEKEYQISPYIHYHATNSVLTIRERPKPMRRREGQLLTCLAEHTNTVVSREQLATWIWGDNSLVSLGTVDVYIKRLRAILGDQSQRIQTVRGIGYQLITDQNNN